MAGTAPADQVAGTSAPLGPVTRVAVDRNGNAYFSDTAQHIVMRWDAGTGNVTIVAGNGTRGSGGDGASATAAQLAAPAGIAVDGDGNLYIADSESNRIRKVAGGTITTIAGSGGSGFSGDSGQAAAAQLNSPHGLALDAKGNLFIADTGNNRIRQIALSTGVITTAVGGGSIGDVGGVPVEKVKLSAPQDVTFDGSGNLYIAGGSDNEVHRVTGGVISAVAGDGTASFGGDSGLALDAQLDFPAGIAVDSAGSVYISDSNNNRIRVVANGLISTLAGNGLADFGGDRGPAGFAALNHPAGLAMDVAGNVFVADQSNSRLRRLSGGIVTTVAGGGSIGDGGLAIGAHLFAPDGVAVDAAGNVYISEGAGHRVRKVSNGAISTIAGTGLPGYAGDNGGAISAKLNSPGNVAVDQSGAVYFVDTGNQLIRKVAKGGISRIAGKGIATVNPDGSVTTSDLVNPHGLAFDSAGRLYISDGGNHHIEVLASQAVTPIAGTGQAGFSGDNGPATNAQMVANGGIAVDSNGNLFLGDAGNYRVREIDAATGVIHTIAGNGTSGIYGDGGYGFAAQVSGSLELAVDGSGNVVVADGFNQRIRKITGGTISTIAGTGAVGSQGDGGLALPAVLDQPGAIAIDAAGNIYFAETGSNRVRVLVPQIPLSITQVKDAGSGGTALTPGMPVIVTGTGLARGAGDTASFTVGGKAAPVLRFVSTSSVVVQIPAAAPTGSTSIAATYGALQAPAFAISLVALAPQILSSGGSVSGYCTDTAGNTITASNPAAPFAEVSCTAIGLGPTSPAIVTGQAAGAPAPTVSPVTVTIGGVTVNPEYAGQLVGTAGGYYQVLFRVPGSMAAGSPMVSLTIGGLSSNSVTLTVGPAVPVITAIVNGATYKTRGAAPNSFISIFGYNFGASDSATNLFPSTSFNGVSVLFNGNPAPLYFVFGTSGQLNLVLPSELPAPANVTVQVRNPAGTSVPYSLATAPTDVGIFRILDPSHSSRINGAVLFANTAWRVMPASMAQALGLADCSGAGIATVCGQPARSGDNISIFLTGAGKATPNGNPASSPLPTGAIAPPDGSTLYLTVQTPTVTIGGVTAKVGFSGIAPGNAGLYQVNVTIPSGIGAGDDIPVVISMPGGTSDTVTIAIRN